MVKSILAVSLALVAAAQATVITVISPWGTSTWIAGGAGDITWSSTSGGGPDFTTCSIDLLNGDPKAANLVAHITDPATPIAVSAGKFRIQPIGDFPAGNNYWIRMGNDPNWFYSHTFNFSGKGTIPPLSMAWSATGATAAPAAAASNPSSAGKLATATPRASGNGVVSTASVSTSPSASAAPALSGASTAVVLSAVGVAIISMAF
ncbi:hypothetical protein BC938DRAFT_473568 [Jimgerdemannia flammicorona]|uniref:Yeast cell wall synthesis Kre9/Knh1-like N-terminal domain-containing protein n=1 Tax=Jimgerdemannia flammicorona TaxID=994334 RepID=A0A433QTA8_9FUNG|nr:hypothetical protein BC938DRAFT_473568 [Jimgerdemannia flammicorona]